MTTGNNSKGFNRRVLRYDTIISLYLEIGEHLNYEMCSRVVSLPIPAAGRHGLFTTRLFL
jgi:hypothetical protein